MSLFLQARIRILSLIAKIFAVSSSTATAIRDSNLLSLFEDEIKDRKDMLKTLSALEVLYEVMLYVLVGLPSHFPLFLT
jgi:26S proteasome non-ATPase regulatory subunit 5